MKVVKFLFQILCLFLVAGTAQQLSAQFDYVGRYRVQNLKVVLDDGKTKDEVRMMYLDGDEVVFRYPNQKEGEVARPVSEIKDFIFDIPQSYEASKNKLKEDKVAEGFSELRPIVYALFPYQKLPSSNLFLLFNDYLGLLSQMKQYDEATYFVRNVELQYATPEFLALTMQLTQKLIDEGRRTDAVGILNRLPINSENIDTLEVVINFAHDLRRRGSYTEANFLYNSLITKEDHPFRKWAVLWHAYGDVTQNRVAASRLFIKEYIPTPPDSSDPSFSLYQLIIGKLHWIADEKEKSVMEITRGVVYASLDSEWTAELFYFDGQCYEKLDQIPSAREIYKTIRLFYPNSQWANESYERLVAITPGFDEKKSDERPVNDLEIED